MDRIPSYSSSILAFLWMSQVLEYPRMGLLQGLLHICRHGWHVASIKTEQIGLILQLVAVRLLLYIYIYIRNVGRPFDS